MSASHTCQLIANKFTLCQSWFSVSREAEQTKHSRQQQDVNLIITEFERHLKVRLGNSADLHLPLQHQPTV